MRPGAFPGGRFAFEGSIVEEVLIGVVGDVPLPLTVQFDREDVLLTVVEVEEREALPVG